MVLAFQLLGILGRGQCTAKKSESDFSFHTYDLFWETLNSLLLQVAKRSHK